MEPRDSKSVIYSLSNFLKLQREGTVAAEPGRCLVVWETQDGHNNRSTYDTVYCLRQTHCKFLNKLRGKSGHVMSFPLYYFHNFNPDSFPGSFDSEFHVSSFEVTESCRAILEFIRQEILFESDNASAGLQAEIIKSLVKVFILRLSQHSGTSQLITENRGDVHFVEQFLQLINIHFATKKKVADYAEIMCVSANYLTVRIRETTRQPASYHIQQRILVEAKRLILQNRFRLKEVACRLGYPDTAHFSKWFKNMEGINFTTYQREACQFVKQNRG